MTNDTSRKRRGNGTFSCYHVIILTIVIGLSIKHVIQEKPGEWTTVLRKTTEVATTAIMSTTTTILPDSTPLVSDADVSRSTTRANTAITAAETASNLVQQEISVLETTKATDSGEGRKHRNNNKTNQNTNSKNQSENNRKGNNNDRKNKNTKTLNQVKNKSKINSNNQNNKKNINRKSKNQVGNIPATSTNDRNNDNDIQNDNNNIIMNYDHRNIVKLLEVNQTITDVLAKVWQPWDASTTDGDKFGWCTTNDNVTGLFFTKIPKAASTTGASVTFQIANNLFQRKFGSSDDEEEEEVVELRPNGKPRKRKRKKATQKKTTRRFQKDDACNNWHFHGTKYTRRQKPYLAWTSIRDPASRAVSQTWFRYVTRRRQDPEDKLVIDFLKTLKTYQLNYMTRLRKVPRSGIKPKPRYNLTDTSSGDPLIHAMDMIHTDLMSVYHFIAIAERMPESLVVFKMLYGLEFRDIIVLSSKQAGGYDDGLFQDKCNKIQPAKLTPAIKDYLQNTFTINNYDYVLYAVANKSLDWTIDSLGRDNVQREVEEFHKLQRIAEDFCMKEAIFPCSPNGTLQREAAEKNCYNNDQGCGHECVQRVLLEHVASSVTTS